MDKHAPVVHLRIGDTNAGKKDIIKSTIDLENIDSVDFASQNTEIALPKSIDFDLCSDPEVCTPLACVSTSYSSMGTTDPITLLDNAVRFRPCGL